MDQSTHDVRRAGWLGIITECQQRPANVSAKQWLADNGIKEKAYYYWLHKFRREACGEMQLPAVKTPAEVSFAEINGKRQILMRSDTKLPQPFVSWSNSL